MAGAKLRYEHFEILTDEQGLPLRLGRGGMGTTFRAYDTRLRRAVALKIINERALSHPATRLRFFNEARAAALFDHPNVARVLYLCPEDAEECFFAMELIEGESLAQFVTVRGPRPAEEALSLLRPIVEALGALEAQQLIHRDIKPENLMITRAGSVKLIDFGVVKSLENEGARFDLVQTEGQFVGSVYFASPEQIIGTQPIDGRSDFYSLGATLWHAVTGAPPFSGSRYEVQEGHLHRAPDFAKLARHAPTLRPLLERLLAKAAVDRPADVSSLLAEWDRAQETAAVAIGDTELDASSETTVDLRLSAFGCVPIPAAPPGCAMPPPPARLATDSATGAWLAVREISYQVSGDVRREFLEAARRVLAALPAGGLLRVIEVREERVISEWRRGISAAQLLAAQHGQLPLAWVLASLPSVASAVDRACALGFAQTGFEPAQWLVSFAELGENETPLQRASLPPSAWGAAGIALDPLAGFHALLRGAQTHSSETQIPGAQIALKTNADFLAALARTLHELLGGHLDREASPLPVLNETRNELLRAARNRKSPAASAAAWAQEFADAVSDARPAGARSNHPRVPIVTRVSAGKSPRLRVTIAGTFAAVLCAAVAYAIFRTKESANLPAVRPGPISPVLAATAEAPFINSLGMAFVPVPIAGNERPERVLFAAPEVRRRDYGIFAAAGGKISPSWHTPVVSGVKLPDGPDAEDHPVTDVPWEDAAAFCDWLTMVERMKGRLHADQHYRLPSDHEWSCAAGIGAQEDAKLSPKMKSGMLADTYPWGRGFLVANPASRGKLPGNYAGEESRGTWTGIIEGYADDFLTTAPVGSFPANALGLHDLGGNAWEWCLDEWNRGESPGAKAHVVRGASCINSLPNLLNLSFRKASEGERRELCGFRCILVSPVP